MTEEPERTQQEQGSTFNSPCCTDRAEPKPAKMVACDCAGMMSTKLEGCCGGESALPEEPATPDSTV
jgi:hypothetical protein